MKRDIGQELLGGIAAIKKGKGKYKTVQLPPNVKSICEKMGLLKSIALNPQTIKQYMHIKIVWCSHTIVWYRHTI